MDERYSHGEKRNYEVVSESRGRVLIAGLGLGMILHPIIAKDEVESVTVVERSSDVISLVSPTLSSPKLSIVHGDIFTWRPVKGTKYDTIYFDIWADISADDLEEMKTLHIAFRSFKSKDGWMNSWMREALRNEQRRGRRYGW